MQGSKRIFEFIGPESRIVGARQNVTGDQRYSSTANKHRACGSAVFNEKFYRRYDLHVQVTGQRYLIFNGRTSKRMTENFHRVASANCIWNIHFNRRKKSKIFSRKNFGAKQKFFKKNSFWFSWFFWKLILYTVCNMMLRCAESGCWYMFHDAADFYFLLKKNADKKFGKLYLLISVSFLL